MRLLATLLPLVILASNPLETPDYTENTPVSLIHQPGGTELEMLPNPSASLGLEYKSRSATDDKLTSFEPEKPKCGKKEDLEVTGKESTLNDVTLDGTRTEGDGESATVAVTGPPSSSSSTPPPTVAETSPSANQYLSGLPAILTRNPIPAQWSMRAREIRRDRRVQVAASLVVIAGVTYACSLAYPGAMATCTELVGTNANQLASHAYAAYASSAAFASQIANSAAETASAIPGGIQSGVGYVCQTGNQIVLHLNNHVYALGQQLSGLFSSAPVDQTTCASGFFSNVTMAQCVPVTFS